jgi:hypothetical protein
LIDLLLRLINEHDELVMPLLVEISVALIFIAEEKNRNLTSHDGFINLELFLGGWKKQKTVCWPIFDKRAILLLTASPIVSFYEDPKDPFMQNNPKISKHSTTVRPLSG